MKTTLLLFVVVICVTFCVVQGASCNGKTDQSYCPDDTAVVEINKKTDKSDNKKLRFTIKCKDQNDRTISECGEDMVNPYEGVHINSFRYFATYSSTGGSNKSVKFNNNEQVETFE